MGDWDEKYAFRNTVRPGLGALCSSLGMLVIAEWAEEFFGRFRVRVVTVTPFGPATRTEWLMGGHKGTIWDWVCTGVWTGPARDSIRE